MTPIGATLASTLTDTSGLGGAGSDTGELHCSEEGVCAFGLSGAATNDPGASCSITTPSSRPGSVVGFAATCAGGACLVPEGGQPDGSCTTSCETEADCSPGYSCTDVLDGRYSAWHFVADLVEPPRISACVPNED